jgi:hypothetical protein
MSAPRFDQLETRLLFAAAPVSHPGDLDFAY